MKTPKEAYREYLKEQVEADINAVETYEEWLETELDKMWKEYGCPFL